MQKYDYIIAGAGCSGLMLAFFLTESKLKDKRILLLDSDLKNKDDRTWCFWEKKQSPFEEIVHTRWQEIIFRSQYFSQKTAITPYEYKMLRGIDFYKFVLAKLSSFPNISFLQREIQEILPTGKGAKVITTQETFEANFVFNSCFRPKIDFERHLHLFQHFLGWEIETEYDIFDEKCATLMDFDIPQMNETRFVYVMPLSKRRALVEATIFSPKIEEDSLYEGILKEYIAKELKINHFSISHTEKGAIPMTNFAFPTHTDSHIFHIGTAGGNVKASTGYAFQNIQKQTQHLVAWLEADNQDASQYKPLKSSRFHLYDSLLLFIMQKKRLSTDLIFSHLFKKNPTQRIFAFLDEETHFGQELQVMYSVPTLPFVRALGLMLLNV